ncbi:hypothetical protein EsVE80_03670 [Enterococcus saigonensis]|uniref:SpaA-like prealbumin fold domain-containing protein n=1 Tax=Enterococcus saigonensis TaxID=1805431 RepID=A0A679IM58_9ENTE|nr:SpaA isopeptide-forming pilin-related protein [Enterococcus saigonensis]BCA84844.1 hypothetical protein EsVE80_03670 [Enterococcus saigonensis]
MFTWRPKATTNKNYLISNSFLKVDYKVEVHGSNQLVWTFHYEKNTGTTATQFAIKLSDTTVIHDMTGDNFFRENDWLKEKNESKETLGTMKGQGEFTFTTTIDAQPTIHFDLLQKDTKANYTLAAAEQTHQLTNPHQKAEKQVTEETLTAIKPKAATPITINMPTDLSGWPIDKVSFETKQGNEDWQSIEGIQPPFIFPDTSVRVHYHFNLDEFFLTPAGAKIKKDIDANEGKERNFEFSFEISGDIYLEADIKENLTIDGEKRGEFTITKNGGEDGENHLWTVTFNNENWNKENVQGEMNLTSLIVIKEVTENIDIMINKDAEIKETIQIQPVKNEYSLQKGVSKEPRKITIEKEDYHLVEWEITVTPGRDKKDPSKFLPIKDLRIIDEDITTLYPDSGSKAGFYLVPEALASKISQLTNFELFKLTMEVEGEEKELQAGKDYKLTYDKINDSKFSLVFYNWNDRIDTLITGPVKIQYTTILKDNHPSEVRNMAQSNIGGAHKLDATAKTEYYYDDLKKTAVSKGNGIIEWTVVYHRENKEKIDFVDELDDGIIDFSTLKVFAEIGKGQQLFPSITTTPEEYRDLITLEESNEKQFKLSFSEKIPKGRYILTYRSTHKDTKGQTLVKNKISGGDLTANYGTFTSLAVEKNVIKQILFGEEVESNFEDKTIFWSASVMTVPNAGEILINDAALRLKEGKFYKNGLAYYLNEAAKLKSEEELVTGGKFDKGINQRYLKEKGIIVAYQNGNGEFEEIPAKDITFIIDNGKLVTTDEAIKVDPDSGIAFQSDALKTGEKAAGFQLKIDGKHAGKKIWLAIATNYGNTQELIPQMPISNYLFNTIEALQGTYQGHADANTTWTNNVQVADALRKRGTLNVENSSVTWEILANTRGYAINAGDKIVDHMNVWSFDDNTTSLIQRMTLQDMQELVIYRLETTNDNEKNSSDDWYHDYKEEKLVVGEDYSIIPLKNDGKKWSEIPITDQTKDTLAQGFAISFKKNMGYAAFKISFSTQLDKTIMAAEKGNKNQILNTAALVTTSGTTKTSASVVYTKKASGVYKSAGEFDAETTEIPWTAVVNPEGAQLHNLVIEDSSQDQDIIPGKIKLYYGNLETIKEGNNYWKPQISKESEVASELYQLDYENDSFKITFIQDFVVETPLIIEYSGKPKKADQSYIENRIKINWGEKVTNSHVEKVEIRNISASGTISGDSRMLTIKKHSRSNEEALAGAKFILEKKNGDVWQKVNVSQAEDVTSNSGLLSFTGLKSGAYRIKEIQAPKGYQLFAKYAYFKLNQMKPVITDAAGNEEDSLKEHYYFATSENNLNVTLNVANEESPPLNFEAKKILQGAKGKAVFNFRIETVTDGAIAAYGYAEIKPEEKEAEIKFYSTDKKEVLIQDWRKCLDRKTKYRLVEVDMPEEFLVKYYNDTDKKESNEFIFDEQTQVITFTVINSRPQGLMPSTGGIGTQFFVIVATFLSGGAGLLAFYYWWRNRKIN